MGGYPENRAFAGINGGRQITTGFGRAAVLEAAGQIVEAVKSAPSAISSGGRLRRGPGRRNYYTEL